MLVPDRKDEGKEGMKIALINYGMGNIRSVYNALTFLGASPTIVETASEITEKKIIIPGVGAFGDGGMVTTQSDERNEKLRILTFHILDIILRICH